MKSKTITLGQMITESEVKSLRDTVKAGKTNFPHRFIMKWLATRPEIVSRWEALGVLPDYGAYLLEYYLHL